MTKQKEYRIICHINEEWAAVGSRWYRQKYSIYIGAEERIAHMEKYKILMEMNRKIVFGEEISDTEKEEAVSILLNGICDKEDILKYKRRMKVKAETDNMYPNYYIPPQNGNKKLRLIQGYLPKTNILYANHYELEVIRLLYMFIPENQTVDEMVKNTLQRLKGTCFGNSCAQGECLTTGISVLRFLAVVQPDNTEWIDQLLNPLGEIFLSFGNGQAAIQKGIPMSYLLMAFTDINNEKTKELIMQKKEWLLGLLRRGWITGKLSNGKISEGDTYNLMGKYIIRNAIGTLPEYEDDNGVSDMLAEACDLVHSCMEMERDKEGFEIGN